MSKLKVVNLFAGAGSGKSTGAAYIFSKLKMNGINCELVTEYAKDKTWEKSTKVFENQAYIFGKQYYRLSRLEGEVDIVITDSPLLLSTTYNNNPVLGENFDNVVTDVFNSYDNINYFINRVKPYNSKGRWQTEEEVKLIDKAIICMLDYNEIGYTVANGNECGYDFIVKDILKKLK